ncbi:MAG: alpha/beta hydrolase [Anaerolineae bacterium]
MSTHPDTPRLWLWEGRPPASSPADDFRPWLELYLLPGETTRGAVLVCPGGGYVDRAPHEAAPIAEVFNAAGMHAFVLQYRVAPHRHPAPLLDASRAMRIVRANAEDWHVDPSRIAVCGFSAGGHLTASLGVHFDLPDLEIGDALDGVSCRPDALVLAYPVISSASHVHRGSFENLLGPAPGPDLLSLMSLELQVSDETPPAFLWHTAEDTAVPVENSLRFAEALHAHGVPFELHVYPKGEHGLGLAEGDPHVASWYELCVEWLQGMGWS